MINVLVWSWLDCSCFNKCDSSVHWHWLWLSKSHQVSPLNRKSKRTSACTTSVQKSQIFSGSMREQIGVLLQDQKNRKEPKRIIAKEVTVFQTLFSRFNSKVHRCKAAKDFCTHRSSQAAARSVSPAAQICVTEFAWKVLPAALWKVKVWLEKCYLIFFSSIYLQSSVNLICASGCFITVEELQGVVGVFESRGEWVQVVHVSLRLRIWTPAGDSPQCFDSYFRRFDVHKWDENGVDLWIVWIWIGFGFAMLCDFKIEIGSAS